MNTVSSIFAIVLVALLGCALYVFQSPDWLGRSSFIPEFDISSETYNNLKARLDLESFNHVTDKVGFAAERKVVDGHGEEGGGEEERTTAFIQPDELFSTVITTKERLNDFYQIGLNFWSSTGATDHDVMGGFPDEVWPDVFNSHGLINRHLKQYLDKALQEGRRLVAMDGGAGVARVTRHVLQYYVHEVDVVEQAPQLIAQAKKVLDAQLTGDGDQIETPIELERMADKFEYHQARLQDYVFPVEKYDIVWIQGVMMYLSNDDVVKCLRDAAASLVPGGFLVLKENESENGSSWVDWADSSINRDASNYYKLIKAAGVNLVAEETYEAVDKTLVPDRIYFLQSA